MDYPAMQDQPPSRSSGTRRKPGPLGGFAGLDPRRRAILLGGAIAVIGLAMLLRPHPHPAGPVAGSDPATLAGLITLPAVPSAVQWRLTPASADADPQDLSKGSWKLEADLTFAPADAAKITEAKAFFKPPFRAGTLQHLDASHLRLTLTSS
jgi:hypothetical protein